MCFPFLTSQQGRTPLGLANQNKRITDLLENPEKAAKVSFLTSTTTLVTNSPKLLTVLLKKEDLFLSQHMNIS